MICPHCHKPLRDDARFCTSCGQVISARNSDPSLPTEISAPDPPKQLTRNTSDPLIGHLLDGKYQLTSILGEGGMGAVYRAQRIHIGDEVAVKVLHTKYVPEAEAIERFRREARAAAQLRHPNVVVIYDYGEAKDAGVLAYIVMELIEGRSLGKILRSEGSISPKRAVSLMRQICSGVGAAHKRNIVHRDLKPDNVVVLPPAGDGEEETVKVVDFGIAKLRDMLGAETLTLTGTIIGTPHYMSPEQCRGEQLDSRSDVYSLGAVFYEMLSGVRPFTAPSAAGVIAKHLTEPAPSLPVTVDLPLSLGQVCKRALAKEPSERQSDATEFGRELVNANQATTAAVPPTQVLEPGVVTGPSATVVPKTLLAAPGLQIETPIAATLASSPRPTGKRGLLLVGAFIGVAFFGILLVGLVYWLGTRNTTEAQVDRGGRTIAQNSPAATNSNMMGGAGATNVGSTNPNANSSRGENSAIRRAILGNWRTKSGKLQLEMVERPTGIEGIVVRIPDSWPPGRVKAGDSIFVKGQVVGNTIEGLYINLPQGNDCQNLETKYSKCVLSFEGTNVRVTNSAYKYSYPACIWSSVTYDDAWLWYRP